ncbi:hypothetical protein D3C85_1592650 [compost metagenome]
MVARSRVRTWFISLWRNSDRSMPICPDSRTLGSQSSLIRAEAWCMAAMRLQANRPRLTSIRVMMAKPVAAR